MQVIEHWLQAPTAYLSVIPNPTTDLWVWQICQILNPALGFVVESKFTEFSRDPGLGLSAHFAIKLKKTTASFQAEPYRLKAET